MRVSGSNLARIEIPLPPLEEQARIVQLLERFEAAEADLKRALEKELQARSEQYSYWRELIISGKTSC